MRLLVLCCLLSRTHSCSCSRLWGMYTSSSDNPGNSQSFGLSLIGAIGAVRPFVKGYGISLTTNTVFTIAIGIYWCYRLFHTDTSKCNQQAQSDDDSQSLACEKGYDVVRVIIVIIVVLVWLLQIGESPCMYACARADLAIYSRMCHRL